MRNLTFRQQMMPVLPAFLGILVSLYLLFAAVEYGNPTYFAIERAFAVYPTGQAVFNVLALATVCCLLIPAMAGMYKTLSS